jgi:hypothetical protein
MEYALKKLNDRELNGQRVSLREVSYFLVHYYVSCLLTRYFFIGYWP